MMKEMKPLRRRVRKLWFNLFIARFRRFVYSIFFFFFFFASRALAQITEAATGTDIAFQRGQSKL